MRGRLGWAALAVVVLAAGGAAALADEDSPEKQQARMLLSQGNQLFEKGDLRAALADFRAAYALYPSPKLLVNAAAAERELGDLPGAATDLRHFLDDATEDDSSLVDKARADLRAVERRCGRVALKAWPRGTALEIDGRASRDPTYVKPGMHSVKVRSPSGIELDKDGEVAAGETMEISVPAGAELGLDATPARATRVAPKKKRAGWVVPVVVMGALVIAGGVTAGVILGTQSATSKPLTSDLGTYTFSQFH
ncbi:MAG TPA: tetratricopeptide repeat protein [Polyangia bacterium]